MQLFAGAHAVVAHAVCCTVAAAGAHAVAHGAGAGAQAVAHGAGAAAGAQAVVQVVVVVQQAVCWQQRALRHFAFASASLVNPRQRLSNKPVATKLDRNISTSVKRNFD
jgi:hypothetical protein